MVGGDAACLESCIVERSSALEPKVADADELRAALERAITDTQQVPFRDAERALARAQFVRDVPAFAAALKAGSITVGHVDVVLRAAKLEPDARAVLLGDADRLVAMAAGLDVDTITRRVRQRGALLRSDEHDDARLQRQRQATNLRRPAVGTT